MAVSHADCTHPRTPAGRRACRAGREVTPLTGTVFAPEVRPVPAPEIKWTAAAVRRAGKAIAGAEKMRAQREANMALNAIAEDRIKSDNRRQRAEKPARIQPRRSGARVSAGGSSCVQAALHTGTGRCACGWHAADHCNTKVWDCAGH